MRQQNDRIALFSWIHGRSRHWRLRAKLAMEETGDQAWPRNSSRARVTPADPGFSNQISQCASPCACFFADFDEVARQAEKVPDELVAAFPGALCSKYTAIGMAKKALRDDASARSVSEGEEILRMRSSKIRMTLLPILIWRKPSPGLAKKTRPWPRASGLRNCCRKARMRSAARRFRRPPPRSTPSSATRPGRWQFWMGC